MRKGKVSEAMEKWERPHDAVIPAGPVTLEPAAAPEVAKPEKTRVTFMLSSEVMDQARDAVYWTPGLTMSGFVEEAMVEARKRLEKKRGEPFPRRKGELKSGRPVR
jgi:hypothetical protein